MNDALGIRLYDKWIRNLRNKKSVYTFISANSYQDIAIYGMGMIGKQLFDELYHTDIHVKYGVDRRAHEISYKGIRIIPPTEITKMEKVSAIIVTPFDIYTEIEKELIDYIDTNDTDIISIQTIVDRLYALGGDA